jgi:hypothetical protein
MLGIPASAQRATNGVTVSGVVLVGAYRLPLRAVGYAPLVLDVQLTAEGREGVEALLRPVAQEIERVRIRARLTPTARHLIDFEKRRKFGMARFSTRPVCGPTVCRRLGTEPLRRKSRACGPWFMAAAWRSRGAVVDHPASRSPCLLATMVTGDVAHRRHATCV